MTRTSVWLIVLVGLAMTMLPKKAHADEGLWLFNNPPRKILKDRYGFDPTDQWLEPRPEVLCSLQQRRFRILRLARRPGDDQSPRWPGDVAKNQQQQKGLRPGWVPRQDAGGGNQGGGPGAQRAHGNRRRHQRGQGGGQAGHDRPTKLSKRGGPSSPRSRQRSRGQRPACGATSSRSTRAASTTSTASSATPTFASFSPRSSRSPFTAATPTTSLIRATISTFASSASTRTTSRSRPNTTSNGARPGPARTSWSSSPAIPATPTG